MDDNSRMDVNNRTDDQITEDQIETRMEKEDQKLEEIEEEGAKGEDLNQIIVIRGKISS